jgi:hypothetical protein
MAFTRVRKPLRPSLAVLALVGLLSHEARSQYQVQTVALAGGPTIPRAPFADSMQSGFHVTGGLGFHFGEVFTIRAEAMYQQLTRKSAEQPRTNQMVGFSGAAEIALLGESGPYVLGGYGFYQTLKSGSVPASQWKPGYNAGGGWRLFFPRFSIFGEVRLHRLRGAGEPAMLPFSVGIRV